MTSSLAIIGRPNVGKSSLFNKLVKKRSAIVTNLSGVTRDKNIGFARISNSDYLIIDTGGINDTGDKLSNDISEHAWDAAIESEIIYVVVDGSEDLTATDLDILSQVRKLNKKFFVVVNKTDKKTNSSVQEELQKKGCIFKTRTDTEVLLKGLILEGPKFQLKCNGMWAFCLWDRRLKKALIGRDRFGIKPLYYYQTDGLFIFGSEMKSITPFMPSRTSK